MIICNVIGDIVSTVKNDRFTGKKIMIVQPLDLDNNPEGKAFLAIDTVQAGVDDRVLVLREGGSARIIFEDNEIPLQAVIVGVIDGIEISEEDNKDGKVGSKK
jgi:microcompartment protein CcmK/EutM